MKNTLIRITLILFTYCILLLFVMCMYNIYDTLQMQHECCRKTNVWNVLNCTSKSEHPPGPHLHLLLEWGLRESWKMCHLGSSVGKQVPGGSVLNDSQILLLTWAETFDAEVWRLSGECWPTPPNPQLRAVRTRAALLAPPSEEVCVERHLNSDLC